MDMEMPTNAGSFHYASHQINFLHVVRTDKYGEQSSFSFRSDENSVSSAEMLSALHQDIDNGDGEMKDVLDSFRYMPTGEEEEGSTGSCPTLTTDFETPGSPESHQAKRQKRSVNQDEEYPVDDLTDPIVCFSEANDSQYLDDNGLDTPFTPPKNTPHSYYNEVTPEAPAVPFLDSLIEYDGGLQELTGSNEKEGIVDDDDDKKLTPLQSSVQYHNFHGKNAENSDRSLGTNPAFYHRELTSMSMDLDPIPYHPIPMESKEKWCGKAPFRHCSGQVANTPESKHASKVDENASVAYQEEQDDSKLASILRSLWTSDMCEAKPAAVQSRRFAHWTTEEDRLLTEAVSNEGGTKISWTLISTKYFHGVRNMNQCKGRWAKVRHESIENHVS